MPGLFDEVEWTGPLVEDCRTGLRGIWHCSLWPSASPNSTALELMLAAVLPSDTVIHLWPHLK